MKTPQQIRNEVEKGCRCFIDYYKLKKNRFIEVYCGDIILDEVKGVNGVRLCPYCSQKLSILTEYDKSIKEMIEDLIKRISKLHDYANVEGMTDLVDSFEVIKELNKLLSKIGDNSEVEK